MKRIILLLALILGLALSGCAPAGGNDIPDTTNIPAVTMTSAAQTPALTPAPTVTPKPTPITTTEPDIAPTLTPEPTPKTTSEPTPTPATEEDEGKVTLADGFYYIKLSDEIKKRITGISYPKDDDDIAISYDDLRYVRIRYYDFEGERHDDGELIVNRKLADEVMEIFYELYKAKYPLASVKLVDDFGQPGDDTLSMEANNTSAFCYRRVTGSKTLSRHSYGAAIDINPVMNPYFDNGRIAPENGAKYADRTLDLPGMIDHDDLCYKLFKEHGWSWGGDWSGDKDYQHFSKDIG